MVLFLQGLQPWKTAEDKCLYSNTVSQGKWDPIQVSDSAQTIWPSNQRCAVGFTLVTKTLAPLVVQLVRGMCLCTVKTWE